MIAGTAIGVYPSLAEASRRLVQLESEITPNSDWVPRYEKLGQLFDQIYNDAAPYYQKLDDYAVAFEGGTPNGTTKQG